MTTCPWCGHPPCDDTTRSQPHHNLCCLDGPRRPCWNTPPTDALDRIMRDDHHDQERTPE